MPWMKVDDNLHAHRKPRKAGVPAMGLWVLAGSWSCDMLSDGFVPDYIAQSLDPDADTHAAALVRAGLWEVAEQDEDEGWRFVGWDEYQPLKSDVEKKREDARERMARVRGKKTAGSGDVRANSEATSRDVPLTPTRPDPSPSTTEDAPLREDVEAICTRLADRIEGNGVKRPNITKSWRDEGRKLIDLDGYTVDDIERVIDWCQQDSFWKSNILSMTKLRKQFAGLKIKADANRPVTLKFDPWSKEAYVA